MTASTRVIGISIQGSGPPFLKPGEIERTEEWVSTQDEIVTDVVQRLGIAVEEWKDVSLIDKRAAFYHSP